MCSEKYSVSFKRVRDSLPRACFSKPTLSMNARNIAIFGGSFDPFHNGHFALLQKVLAQFCFSQLFLTPTFCSPFKEGSFFSPDERLQMCALVAKELESKNCEIVACDFEVVQKRVVYSIELVEYVKKIRESKSQTALKNLKILSTNVSKIFFILGLDSFATLHRWYQFERLCEEVEFIVCDRADSQSFQTTLENLQNFSSQKNAQVRAHFLEFTSHLNSTQLRAELQKSSESKQLDSLFQQIPSCLHSFMKEILLRKEFAK